MIKNIIILLCFLLWSGQGMAQNCIIYNESNSDIPYNGLSAVEIDPDGKIWVGTFLDGIGIFDGNTWVNYDDFNSGLPYYSVNDIQFDSVGNAWISTYKGLAKFSKDGIWTVYDTSNTIIPGNDITAFAFDDNGVLWIGSKIGSFSAQNIVTFDGITWTELTGIPPNAQGDIINGFAFENSRTWIAMDGGVLKYENSAFEFYPYAYTGLWSSHAVTIDTSGDVWFAGFKGILRRTLNDWYFTDHELEFGMPQNSPYSTIFPDGNYLWLGNLRGLIKFNKLNKTITLWNDTNSCLPSPYVNDIAVDSAGNMWLATSNGLVRFEEMLSAMETAYEGPLDGTPSVFPSPASGEVTVDFKMKTRSSFCVEIISSSGHLVKKMKIKNGQGRVNQKINLSEFNPGLYFLKVINGENLYVEKIILLPVVR